MGVAKLPQAESPQSGKASSAVTRADIKPRQSFFKNPFSRSPRVKSELRVVQIELLLDAVKPVCNDLNDSDLEVVTVPAGPAIADAVKSTGENGGREQSGEPAWGRIKAQVFGAGKS